VVAYPVAHRMAAVPGGVVPDQQQSREALGGALGGAPRQERDRDGTDGTPRDQPEPHLLPLRRLRPPQQPITGQGLGSRSIRRRGDLLQLRRGLGGCPTMLRRLRQPAPPNVVTKT
jgi:hypothetical protein